MKVFISQPMAGKTGEEIISERNHIKDLIRKDYGNDVEFLESFVTDKCPVESKNAGVWYLGRSLEIMSHADMVYFAKGFEKGNGCMLEYDTAKMYGLRIEKEL